jgi:hypothetical protein
MGMECIMLDKVGPSFPNPLRSPQDKQFKEIMEREVDVKTELDYVYKAITVTRKKLNGRVPLIGFCGAPWTLHCYMVEGGGTKMFRFVKTWIFKHPEETKALLQKIAELCVEYLALQVVAGAQVCYISLVVEHLLMIILSVGSGLRFLGRRAFTDILQTILPSISRIHCRQPSKETTRAQARGGTNDGIRKRVLVCSGRSLQYQLQCHRSRLVARPCTGI